MHKTTKKKKNSPRNLASPVKHVIRVTDSILFNIFFLLKFIFNLTIKFKSKDKKNNSCTQAYGLTRLSLRKEEPRPVCLYFFSFKGANNLLFWKKKEQTTCHLLAQIAATIMVAGKLGELGFLLKKPNF